MIRGPRTFLRSAAVGAGATAVDIGALWLLTSVAALPVVWANIPALSVGVLAQFAGNKWFAFEDRTGPVARQGAQFALVEAGAFGLNALGFHLLVTVLSLPFAAARLIGSGLVYVAYSYPLWRMIFNSPEQE